MTGTELLRLTSEGRPLGRLSAREERFCQAYAMVRDSGPDSLDRYDEVAEDGTLLKVMAQAFPHLEEGREVRLDIAHALLSDDRVLERIDSLRRQTYEITAGTTKEALAQELLWVAKGNIQDCFYQDGALVPVSQLPHGVAAAIQSYEVTKEGARIKFHSKLGAIDQLAGMYGYLDRRSMRVEAKVDLNKLSVKELEELMAQHLEAIGEADTGTRQKDVEAAEKEAEAAEKETEGVDLG